MDFNHVVRFASRHMPRSFRHWRSQRAAAVAVAAVAVVR